MSAMYRPLNVRDALSYLDQVKAQFQEQPEVYNRFLDVMKEFKSQIIDTPGVIDRVSTLFRGHPNLIQGFNTFLPPGYRIECISDDGPNKGMITVYTPTGTVQHVAGDLSATIAKQERETQAEQEKDAKVKKEKDAQVLKEKREATSRRTSPVKQGSPPKTTAPLSKPKPNINDRPWQRDPPKPQIDTLGSTPGNAAIPAQATQPAVASGPSTPIAASFATIQKEGIRLANVAAPQLEFNHAISFVNKIKNRYDNDPDKYKTFLEILQTYQRDTRDIVDVYEQVRGLFGDAPDLLNEFKQFLPENGQSGFGGFMQLATGAQAAPEKAPAKRGGGAKDVKDGGPQKKRRGPADGKAPQRKKTAQKAETPSGDEGELTGPIPGAPQTLASPDEVAFFDKVKKFIDDKVSYHEFLKLINLFVQDMIDTKMLYERAEMFIGTSPEVWPVFKKMIGADDMGNTGPIPVGSTGGYGFGGMIGIDAMVVENTPMLERVKPDLNSAKVKAYGPSYRKLPTSEINLQCTGRDSMCWEVLNDEWVSHPTWAAEDAAPFMAHKKNQYEEQLHKSEEERHEYDYHIEANLRTIALLEPLNNKIQTMDPEERLHFNLKAGLGGQSKSIYQRIIKKVYGKELGPEIVRALHENPVVALPIILERLKSKDEEWKKAQREWNRVWREQDQKNFYKALDHQGVQFKNTDKKVLQSKSLITEIEARKREQINHRLVMLDARPWRARPQFDFVFADVEVLKDVLKLVISYLDRVNNSLSTGDKAKIEDQLRSFVPALFMFDKEEFDAEFGDVGGETPEDGEEKSEDSEGEGSLAEDEDGGSGGVGGGAVKKGGLGIANGAGKKGASAGDLRKRLLKQVREKGGRGNRGSTATPGPDDRTRSVEGTPMTDGGRAETPLPVPADPEAVAEALEKDKAVAEASEEIWANVDTRMNVDTPEGSAAGGSAGDKAEKKTLPRKATFFANTHYYILIRLIQILYSRLLSCKNIAAKLATEKKQPINPVAINLGLAEPETQHHGVEAGENPAQHYYTHLLSMAERLFEADVDVGSYEETLRLMFGTKAYVMFTLDRVVAAIVKQTQTVLGDMKSQELVELLKRDRTFERTTTRRQIAYRTQAENVIGPDESVFKMEYLHTTESITVQLLGKDDLSVNDAETADDQWRQYVDSYVMVNPTEGLPVAVPDPFLRRTRAPKDSTLQSNIVSKAGVELKIAMGNYRMLLTPGTEDYYHYILTHEEVLQQDADEEAYEAKAKVRLDKWVEDKRTKPLADNPPGP